MTRSALCIVVALTLGAAHASAQESIQTVRELYAAAAYEDALAAVTRMPATQSAREVQQYRVFSLTALGRNDEALHIMETLIREDPSFVLDPAETPPRVQEAFGRVQQRVLPELTKQLYVEARAALDRRDRQDAIGRFERLLKIINGAGPAKEALGDMRILAEGFLDLSKALPVASPPTAGATTPQTASTAPATPAAKPGAGVPAASRTGAMPAALPPAAAGSGAVPSGAVVDTPPVAVVQTLPPWFPTDMISRRSAFSGSVRVEIGVDGRVRSATITDSVHPVYDQALLRAARGWSYQPATRNGVPVMSELTVEVNLQPRE